MPYLNEPTQALLPTSQKALDKGITLAAMLLDRSGSMEGEPAIQLLEGAADFLEEMRELPVPVSIAFDLFSTGPVSRDTFKPVSEAAYLTSSRYRIQGSTAIFDAIHAVVDHVAKEKRPQDRAVVSIFTDGEENASKQHGLTDTRALVLAKQAEGWIFIFAGPTSAFASSIGIRKEHQIALKGGDIKGLLAELTRTVVQALLPPKGGTIQL